MGWVSGGNMQTRKTGRSWGRRRIRHPRKLVPHQLGNRQVAAYSRVVYTANVYGNTSITAPVRLGGSGGAAGAGLTLCGDQASTLPHVHAALQLRADLRVRIGARRGCECLVVDLRAGVSGARVCVFREKIC